MAFDDYPSTYASARERFRAAAARLGCALEAHAIEARGPDGERLTIDVAISPGGDPQRTLLLSSGIHGVEGFFGSAVQLALLRQWAEPAASQPPCRWVMVHALNPYGFAWRRRVNEDNIDLNRNLLPEGRAYAGSPDGYADLDGLLNPASPPASGWDPVRLRILAAILRHGMPALKQAVASGQYDHPQGLFFGGRGPSATNRILCEHFERWLGNNDGGRVFHLDLHTGLGDSGTCKLLLDHVIDDRQKRWLDDHFGTEAYEQLDAEKVAYGINGSFGLWGHGRAGSRDYLYAAAEMGTYPAPRMLTALRAENRAHLWGRPDDAATRKAKAGLVEAFCPQAPRWRRQVLDRGLELVAQAVAGLRSGHRT
ncbi:MAG: hypothetical protein NVS9B10_25060 [Nevskia sp.]